MSETTIEQLSVVKAIVNEKNFFASMKHLFASSFSVVGELLQNSRRAGATRIDVKSNFVNSELEFIDNGHGIADFSKLLELSASGWSEETKIKENPFGMGFFSCFGIADRVEVRSKGTLLSACIEDLVKGRQIALSKLDNDNGMTSIKLIGVSEKVMGTNDKHFAEEIQALVLGFDTPIFLNDYELDRPHAQENRQGEDTIIGFVSLKTVHFEAEDQIQSEYKTALYLQGLPISDTFFRMDRVNAIKVVHLDGAKFTPQMPDRESLYDEREQSGLIDREISEVYKRFIIQMKAQLAPEAFVNRYADYAVRMGLGYLLNSIPFLPKSFFSLCESVVICTNNESAFGCPSATKTSKLYAMDEFVKGNLRVWMNAPGSADDDCWAVTAMKIMQREAILSLDEEGLDKGHWIFKHATDFNHLEFEVTPKGEHEKSSLYCWSTTQALIKRASEVVVAITDGAGQTTNHTIVNDWIMSPRDPRNDPTGNYNCWIAGVDESNDHPVNALDTFFSDHDEYKESWEDEAKGKWADVLGQLYNEHMAQKLARALQDKYLSYADEAAGQMAIARLSRRSRLDNAYGRPEEDFIAVDPEFMDNLTTALKLETGKTDIETKQVIRAFLSVVRPDLHVGGPRDGCHIGQW